METLETLQKTVDAQQAVIDKLMFEFCPEDMTPEQIKRYEAAQKPVLVTSDEFAEETTRGLRTMDIALLQTVFLQNVYNTLKHYEGK